MNKPWMRTMVSGFRILTAAGVQSAAELPFAGLHQLARAVQREVDSLPSPQREAMLAAFGRTSAAAPDLFLIALGALDLLSDAAAHSPLLVIAEDAQWLDRPTCDVLTFVARRLESDPITLLMAAFHDGPRSTVSDCGSGRPPVRRPLPPPPASVAFVR